MSFVEGNDSAGVAAIFEEEGEADVEEHASGAFVDEGAAEVDDRQAAGQEAPDVGLVSTACECLFGLFQLGLRPPLPCLFALLGRWEDGLDGGWLDSFSRGYVHEALQ